MYVDGVLFWRLRNLLPSGFILEMLLWSTLSLKSGATPRKEGALALPLSGASYSRYSRTGNRSLRRAWLIMVRGGTWLHKWGATARPSPEHLTAGEVWIDDRHFSAAVIIHIDHKESLEKKSK